MEINIKGSPEEIAALVVGLQKRQETDPSYSNQDEGNRESMIKAVEGRLARLKSNSYGTEERLSLLEKQVDMLAAAYTCKNGVPRKEWDELFTQTDPRGRIHSECQE